MNMTWRWYGRGNDIITLEQIMQIPNVKGIVWALHNKVAGEVWPLAEIEDEVNYIKSFGFHANVVESVNIHDSIKIGSPDRDHYIENYKETIRNLGKVGVKVICYNFMPVFDWTRTELYYELPDGSTALFYEKAKVADIEPQDLINKIANSTSMTMPGWEPERLAKIQELFEAYANVSEDDLWDNLKYFLQSILPTCEEVGIQMAIHPDDPPWSIFGLPRIMTGEKSLEKLVAISDSPSNGITFCTGSLGANPSNNMVEIASKYLSRSPFAHLRNVKIFENGDFVETSHLTSDGSVDLTNVVKQMAIQNYTGYVRPDHGRHLWNEEGRPGYGLYDRALGVMYLNGLWDAHQSYK